MNCFVFDDPGWPQIFLVVAAHGLRLASAEASLHPPAAATLTLSHSNPFPARSPQRHALPLDSRQKLAMIVCRPTDAIPRVKLGGKREAQGRRALLSGLKAIHPSLIVLSVHHSSLRLGLFSYPHYTLSASVSWRHGRRQGVAGGETHSSSAIPRASG